MPQATQLTVLKQGRIRAYKDSGMSIHQIAKKLAGQAKLF